LKLLGEDMTITWIARYGGEHKGTVCGIAEGRATEILNLRKKTAESDGLRAGSPRSIAGVVHVGGRRRAQQAAPLRRNSDHGTKMRRENMLERNEANLNG
jgi:hypothetical protein